MANLDALYKEYGLSGIVRHAFRHESDAYRFVLEKVKGEAALYFLALGCTGCPMMDVDTAPTISIFSSKREADEKCAAVSSRMDCSVISVGNGGDADKETAFRIFRDLGAYCILLDDAIRIPIAELAESASYDGYKEGLPLRNEQINVTILLIRQNQALNLNTENLFVNLMRLLGKSGFVAPLAVAEDRDPGPLRNEDLRIPLFNAEDRVVSYWFSDGSFFDRFIEANPDIIPTLGIKLLYFGTLDDIRSYFNAVPDSTLVLNPGATNLEITRDLFVNAEAMLSQQSAAATANKVPDDDPMPEFLR